MKQPSESGNLTSSVEGIDFEKLSIVFKKNFFWVVFIFLAANFSSFLIIRYTRDLFESESELKLDIKRDATDLGIKTVIEDQSLNIVSGEIEQIKSKLFIRQLLDSMNLDISYYSLGQVLKDETYKRSPFNVRIIKLNRTHYDLPLYFDLLDVNHFQLRLGENGKNINGTYGEPLKLDDTEFVITKTSHYEENDGNDYYFVFNSRASLIDYLSENLGTD